MRLFVVKMDWDMDIHIYRIIWIQEKGCMTYKVSTKCLYVRMFISDV